MIAALREIGAPPFMAAEYVLPEYSRRQIEAAGKGLAGTLTDVDEAVGIFRIAYNWRDAHVYPMRRVRYELAGIGKRAKSEAITAARIKRMKSIRKKLRETPLTLYQIQDLGGCRIIVRTMDQFHKIIGYYNHGCSRHEIIRQWRYVDDPKGSGYRSHHIVMKFNGEGEDSIYNRQRIEIQIRTRLHIWATAVEAAGLVRGEDLKSGKGDRDWLRLFEIMSSEIANIEKSPGVPGVTENISERRDELRYLNNRINAAGNLKTWNDAIKKTDEIPNSISKFYVIQYDPDTRKVMVEPSLRISQGSESLIQEELSHGRRDTVFVEIEKAEDLKEAYPNYFLDVKVFADLLHGAMAGKTAAELEEIITPREPTARRPITPTPAGIWNFGRWRRRPL